MNSKIIPTIALTTILSTMLVGCDSTDSNNKDEDNNETQVVAEKKSETKDFEPYEHVFYKAYSNLSLQGQIEIPDGYEILEIENYNSRGFGDTTVTGGCYIWFTNKETVQATLVINNSNGLEEYSEPGVVIQKDKDIKTYEKK